jgi:hypothetical protein
MVDMISDPHPSFRGDRINYVIISSYIYYDYIAVIMTMEGLFTIRLL